MCPICAKQHIEKLHRSRLPASRSLQVGPPLDPSALVRELEGEIAALKSLMKQQTKKLAGTLALLLQSLH
jgi:hypothetical protein